MVSYTLGYQIGGQLAAQIREGGLDLDPDAFAQAIADVLSGRPPAMTSAQMEAALGDIFSSSRMQDETPLPKPDSPVGEAFQVEYSQRQGCGGDCEWLAVSSHRDGRRSFTRTLPIRWSCTTWDN